MRKNKPKELHFKMLANIRLWFSDAELHRLLIEPGLLKNDFKVAKRKCKEHNQTAVIIKIDKKTDLNKLKNYIKNFNIEQDFYVGPSSGIDSFVFDLSNDVKNAVQILKGPLCFSFTICGYQLYVRDIYKVSNREIDYFAFANYIEKQKALENKYIRVSKKEQVERIFKKFEKQSPVPQEDKYDLACLYYVRFFNLSEAQRKLVRDIFKDYEIKESGAKINNLPKIVVVDISETTSLKKLKRFFQLAGDDIKFDYFFSFPTTSDNEIIKIPQDVVKCFTEIRAKTQFSVTSC